jgi:hypothetical protein
MSIIERICFEIHLYVQAPFHGAGVKESTVSSTLQSICTLNLFRETNKNASNAEQKLIYSAWPQ